MPACERDAPREVIATAATQREAIEIAAALEQRDVPAVRVEERRSSGRVRHAVTTPAVAATTSRRMLTELGLPRPPREQAGDEASIFPTRADETARERRRRAMALERSLELLDGVTVASVVVAEAQGDATGRAATRPTLLVTLRSAGLAGTPAETPLRDRTVLAVRATFPEIDPATDATIIVAGTAAERVGTTTAMNSMAASTTPHDERTSGLTTLDRTLMAFTVAAMLTLAWLQWRSLRRATEVGA